MKKFILIGVLALTTVIANAQVAARSYKFIPANVSTLIVSNTIAITNLSSVASAWTTNKVGTAWTNNYGVGIVATNGDKVKLLQDVPLWALRDGSPAWNQGVTNSIFNYIQSYATLAVTGTAQSGANAAVTFVFAPLYGDKEATDAAQLWTFSLTPTASTTQTMVTNAPMYLWPGATALRLRRVVNIDTDATSAWLLTDISLNGYVSTSSP